MGEQSNAKLATKFAERTGYHFSHHDLLVTALTHPSCNSVMVEDYQRLEFLGDRVLGLVIADDLFRRFPEAAEGDLARQYNYLVRKQTCSAVAEFIDLGELIRLQNVAEQSSVVSMRILGDACEAVIAAVYLDSGFELATEFVLKFWRPFLIEAETAIRDAKTRLQEWSLGQGLGVPDYDVVSRSGPDHAPKFRISARLSGYETEFGEASSKRKAEQLAAQAFIETNRIPAE